MKQKLPFALLSILAIALVPHGADAMPGADVLGIAIQPRSGSTIEGTASFREVAEYDEQEEIGQPKSLRGGVRVVLDIKGASAGKHGVHIHEKGDCSAPDAKSAGEHFSPEGYPHGLPPTERRHLGDLGNIEVSPSGTGHLDFVAFDANLHPDDPASFVGRAIIVHANEDDGSQPNGNAGARIGCGEIRP